MVTKQAYYSDKSKQAQKKSNKAWGGRHADGYLDNYENVFAYKEKRKNQKAYTYYYNNKTRKKWQSYGKKYK